MKSIIRDISAEMVPWQHPAYAFSHNPGWRKQGKSELGILRILTEDGLEGNAFCGSFARDVSHSELALRPGFPALKAALVGCNAFDRERLWAELQMTGRMNDISSRWINAVDIALWDLAGKAAGMPVHQMLGSFRDKVLAYASSPDYPDVPTYMEEARKYKALGYKGYKIHGGSRTPAEMIGLCEAVRKAVGDEMKLMLDTGPDPCTLQVALQIGHALEQLKFHWYEEPMLWSNVENFAELTRRLEIPIALHDLVEPRQFPLLTYIMHKAGSIIRSDAVKDGITGLKKLAGVCEAHGLNLELHHGGNSLGNVANLHVIMSIPNTEFFEQIVPEEWHQFGLVEDIRVDREGYVHAPQKPGLGFEIDWKLIRSLEPRIVT
jgi:L-alanine-DL-glutamate epimerase-like enolase superfamily enzyme